MPQQQSLDVGTVVKITQIDKEVIDKVLHLKVGMEGVVTFHNAVFRIDDGEESDQTGPNGEPMFFFVMPGSNIRIGPVVKMPDDHKVIAWIVAGKLWNVTNVNVLFNGSVRWYVKRSGEVIRLTG